MKPTPLLSTAHSQSPACCDDHPKIPPCLNNPWLLLPTHEPHSLQLKPSIHLACMYIRTAPNVKSVAGICPAEARQSALLFPCPTLEAYWRPLHTRLIQAEPRFWSSQRATRPHFSDEVTLRALEHTSRCPCVSNPRTPARPHARGVVAFHQQTVQISQKSWCTSE